MQETGMVLDKPWMDEWMNQLIFLQLLHYILIVHVTFHGKTKQMSNHVYMS